MKKKKTFSFLFIFLLLLAEFGGLSGKNFPADNNRSLNFSYINSTLNTGETGNFPGVEKGNVSLFLRDYGHTVHDDIEINKSIQNISARFFSVKTEIRLLKQSKRVNADPMHPFGKNGILLSLCFYKIFAICLTGMAFTYSLQFIIRYIHFKNGEKMVVSSLL